VYHTDKILRNAHAEEPPAAIHYAGKGSPRDEAIKKYIVKNQWKGDIWEGAKGVAAARRGEDQVLLILLRVRNISEYER
jgi:hypothetical protein